MNHDANTRPSNPFARLGAAEIFAINMLGFYGTGALLRDLLGVMHIQLFSGTSVGWRVAGAASFAIASHYWRRRDLKPDGSASRPAV